MGITIFVVEHGAALDGLLGDLQGNVDQAILVGGGAFNCQLERIECVAGIAAGNLDEVFKRVII
jgi:hypothetical protein